MRPQNPSRCAGVNPGRGQVWSCVCQRQSSGEGFLELPGRCQWGAGGPASSPRDVCLCSLLGRPLCCDFPSSLPSREEGSRKSTAPSRPSGPAGARLGREALPWCVNAHLWNVPLPKALGSKCDCSFFLLSFFLFFFLMTPLVTGLAALKAEIQEAPGRMRKQISGREGAAGQRLGNSRRCPAGVPRGLGEERPG